MLITKKKIRLKERRVNYEREKVFLLPDAKKSVLLVRDPASKLIFSDKLIID